MADQLRGGGGEFYLSRTGRSTRHAVRLEPPLDTAISRKPLRHVPGRDGPAQAESPAGVGLSAYHLCELVVR